MKQSLNKYYLSAMGIECWRLKPNNCYSLFDSNGILKIVLLAEINPGQIDKEQELLLAIIRALNFTAKQDLPVSVDASIPVIILGNNSIPKSLQHSRHFKTYSPAEMLVNPQLKAKVWQLISPLREMKENSK